MQNWDETLLSQFADSPTLYALLESLNDAIDPSADIQEFYNNIWNVNTAVGNGLDIWGRIVGVPRTLKVATPQTYFGFNEAMTTGSSTNPQPFNQAPFYRANTPLSVSYALSDSAYRQLILVKAAANISDCSIPSINAILRYLFGGVVGSSFVLGQTALPATLGYGTNNVYVNDLQNMTYQIVSTLPLTLVDVAVITSGVMPKPSGVSFSVVQG